MFRVLLINNATESQKFTAFDAKTNLPVNDIEVIDLLKRHIEELTSLSFYRIDDDNFKPEFE